MHLYDIPLLFVLIGLVMYIVLGGADFGVGVWELTAGTGESGERVREHAHESMAPVWEANHVWLIFVLTVNWTSYPTAFGSIATTLSVPLFLAAIGIVLRGAAYALRPGTRVGREARTVDVVFSLSSILSPFALGTVVGGIAARRVPVGNAAGHLFSSWLNPTAVLIGVLSVAFSAYLAAVFLAADSRRRGDTELERQFRVRALWSGVAAGALAVAGLVVIHADAPFLYHPLLSGAGLVPLIISVVAGLVTMGLVATGRHEPARYTAALAVTAIVAGWAAAQQPLLLPHLTIPAAAAPHDTLVLVIIAVLGGGVILFPSLALLFRLALGGRLGGGYGEEEDTAGAGGVGAVRAGGVGAVRGGGTEAAAAPVAASRQGLATRLAVVALLAGVALVVFTDASWTHVVGAACLVAFIVSGFAAMGPEGLAERSEGLAERSEGLAERSDGLAERSDGLGGRSDGLGGRPEP